jgi:hypothetical protein
VKEAGTEDKKIKVVKAWRAENNLAYYVSRLAGPDSSSRRGYGGAPVSDQDDPVPA